MTQDPRKTGASPRCLYTWPRPVGGGRGGGHLWQHWTNSLSSRWLWPGSLTGLALAVGGVVAVRYTQLSFLQPIRDKMFGVEDVLVFLPDEPRKVCACGLLGVALFIVNIWAKRGLLRLLLRYRTWMYEPPSQQSWETTMWASAVKFLSGWSSPRLFSCSSSMPRLPVPSLSHTVSKLVDSFEPLYRDDPVAWQRFKDEAQKFQATTGPKLQRALMLRSWWVDNYVSDWWEKYVYLMSRLPLPINSNYYICDQGYWTPTRRQCARAACFILHYVRVWESILGENLEPLMIKRTVPVCMEQYRRVLSTTRVPGLEMDSLVHYSPKESQHIVVNRRGLLYRVEVTDNQGRLISPSVLEQQLDWVLQDADSRYEEVAEADRQIPALTSVDRTQWAQVRAQYFSSGVNKETLASVESALLYLFLDPESFDELSSRASHLLHGKVGQLWFDKSVQVIAMSDGHIGLNCEHSHADAPVVAHFLEYNLTYDLMIRHRASLMGLAVEGRLYHPATSPADRDLVDSALSNMYDADGHCLDPAPTTPSCHIRAKPLPLVWEMSQGLTNEVTRACHQASKNISDLDLVLYDHKHFGKGVIKKCRLSPDGFIQMALHLTFKKLMGKNTLTYEASMTRLYHKGRTETVRSLTKEAHDFVQGFLDPEVSRAEVRSRLRAACERHAHNYKNCMNGGGVDRHLFALYVASRGMGVDCKFLKEVLSVPWTLSTSQQPQQQIPWSPDGSDPKYQDMLSPGGGFGPVAADGFGVSYMVAGENRIFFHVSSLRSAPSTDSRTFVTTLTETLSDMRDLFANPDD